MHARLQRIASARQPAERLAAAKLRGERIASAVPHATILEIKHVVPRLERLEATRLL